MSEITPAGGGGSSRQVFVILAIGLAGLLVLGLIGLGGYFLIARTSAPPPATSTPVRTATATRTIAPLVVPTATDVATFTPVIQTVAAPPAVTGTPIGGTATVTGTVISGTPGGTGTPQGGKLPNSGLGEDLLLLAGGVVLVMVIFVARRARATTA